MQAHLCIIYRNEQIPPFVFIHVYQPTLIFQVKIDDTGKRHPCQYNKYEGNGIVQCFKLSWGQISRDQTNNLIHMTTFMLQDGISILHI